MRFRLFLLITLIFVAINFVGETKPPEKPIVINKISDWFEGVTFDHTLHSSINCEQCHHAGFDNGANCDNCHNKVKKSSDEVSLKDAYHKVCSECHFEKGKSVKEGCETCHKRKNLPSY